MSEGLKTLETMVGAQLAKEPLPTPERIRELISQIRIIPMCSDVTDDEAENLALSLEESHGVSMNIGSMLKTPEYVPWLSGARSNITPYYWDRYRKLLTEKGFSGQVLASLDEVTDRILNLMENPLKEGVWDRRGMVVGHVQSGKTANYTGVICKAADAGYKLIVVIAGIHNNLRNQTQLRIDEGFVGRDSARLLSNRNDRVEKFIGVGRYDKSRRPVTFTNSLKDFNKAMATGVGVPLENLNEPAVFVIKKNSSTLRNLLEWLDEHNAKAGKETIDVPMMLIDDEADNASINVGKGKDEVSRINGQIRSLLRMFDRSCYVGYTATPFANIFIDPESFDAMHKEDLFPRDFIVSLDPPSNYFGASRIFIDEPESIIRHIEDNEDFLPLKHQKDFSVTSLPGSLIDAIRTFLVGMAIRHARGQVKKHSSMLVNASRFTDVQTQLRNEIHGFVENIKSSIRINGSLGVDKALKDDEIKALYDIWDKEFNGKSEISWPDIHGSLYQSIAPVSVVEVNSKSSGTLNYADNESSGLSVIAVGGFSLSRGLTLEGLMVSYFLRNSMMYDTLMQMGRWFGYRPGYDDLCRIWMPEEAEGWYAHVTESIEELREELRRMEAANATPEQFGLKVRSHPDTLIVTARNKMGSGEKLVVSIGLANSFIETSILNRDKDSLLANREAVKKFIERLSGEGVNLANAESGKGGLLLRNIPVKHVVTFLTEFRNHPGSLLTDGDPVRRYIEERSNNELDKWDLFIPSISSSGADCEDDALLGINVCYQRRTAGTKSNKDTLYITNKQRVSSRGVEANGLSDPERDSAEEIYRINHPVKEGKRINYPDRIYREVRQKPLFVLHVLKITDSPEAKITVEHELPVVAWSISFPKTRMEERKVEYVVNTTWLRENYAQDIEEDEMSGDDGD